MNERRCERKEREKVEETRLEVRTLQREVLLSCIEPGNISESRWVLEGRGREGGGLPKMSPVSA